MDERIMTYTMRSAFKRWLILHHEEYRATGYIRIPKWFRDYMLENKEWRYTVADKKCDEYCNRREMDYNQRRRYKGYYSFEISDEELLELQRAEWISG